MNLKKKHQEGPAATPAPPGIKLSGIAIQASIQHKIIRR